MRSCLFKDMRKMIHENSSEIFSSSHSIQWMTFGVIASIEPPYKTNITAGFMIIFLLLSWRIRSKESQTITLSCHLMVSGSSVHIFKRWSAKCTRIRFSLSGEVWVWVQIRICLPGNEYTRGYKKLLLCCQASTHRSEFSTISREQAESRLWP